MRLETVLSHSPADETELVWLETRRGRAASRSSDEITPRREHTVLVRVQERGRVGLHRTCSRQVSELSSAVRLALAQSRIHEPIPGLPHLPADDSPVKDSSDLHDAPLAELDLTSARALLQQYRRKGERCTLEWWDTHVAVVNSRGVRRKAAVTGASVEVRCGRRPGAGSAAGAARSLSALAIEEIFVQARQHHGSRRVAEMSHGRLPVVLAPQATVELVDLLNGLAFSARAYREGTSFLREHLGVQVFDRALNLRDDGTDSCGLPFPFDLEGTAKRRVELISHGTPRTPALDQRQAALLGLPATGHAIGGDDARASHLFLECAERSEAELCELADGGVWIGRLERIEALDPLRVGFSARAEGVRRIASGKLAESLPNLVWEDSLLRALSNLLGIGATALCRPGDEIGLGGICAPALALVEASELRPVTD